jgi:hypothetical protein
MVLVALVDFFTNAQVESVLNCAYLRVKRVISRFCNLQKRLTTMSRQS